MPVDHGSYAWEWISKTWWGMKSSMPTLSPASAIFPLLYRQPPVETYWQPMTSLWSMGLECTHERGEKFWLFAKVASYTESIFIQCKHISRHFRGFICFFEITHLCGVARQPARISCFMPFFSFKRVGKPPLTKLKKNDNTQRKLPSFHIAPLGPRWFWWLKRV